MKILIVSPNLPYPPDDGGRIRIFNLVKFLSISHEVTLLCFAWEHTGELKSINEMRRFCKKVVPVPRKLDAKTKIIVRLKHLLNLFSCTPWMVEFLETREMKDKLKGLLKEEKFDVVQLEYGYLAGYADTIKQTDSSAIIAVDQHNVEWALKYRIAGNKSQGLFSRLFSWYEGFRFLGWEKRKAALIDVFLFVSENDAKLQAGKILGIKTAIAPNGVDTQYLKQAVSGLEGKPDLLFLGKMDWLPNEDSALYFAREIFPRIKKKYPDILFYIAGKGSLPALKHLASDKNIRLTGYVGDIREYYSKNFILVVPMRIGGGTRFKIVEAMASGVPVVSTSIGCEGLGVEHGENILIADSPDEFTAAVSQIINNDALKQRLRAGGRKLAETCYDWRTVVNNLEKVYSNMSGK